MTRFLAGDWTRDLPHSMPAFYHEAIEETVVFFEMWSYFIQILYSSTNAWSHFHWFNRLIIPIYLYAHYFILDHHHYLRWPLRNNIRPLISLWSRHNSILSDPGCLNSFVFLSVYTMWTLTWLHVSWITLILHGQLKWQTDVSCEYNGHEKYTSL